VAPCCGVPLLLLGCPLAWQSKRKEVELRGHSRSVDNLSWHPSNPDVLASTSQDKAVRFWDHPM